MPALPRFQAAIFDFDGVIADSIPQHFESFRRLFSDEGVGFTMDDYRRVANGRPRDEVIQAMMGRLDPVRLRDLMARKERYILELVERRGIQPIPGALELARAFRERGLRTAVASSSRTARRFLERLCPIDAALGRPQDLFDAVLEGDSSRAAKPDPEVYLAAARALGVPAARCLAIEDAVNGVRSARAAGMWVVAVTTTEDAAALRESHQIVGSFAEIDPDALLAGEDS